MSRSIRIGSTELSLAIGDIAQQETDAIVNAANPTLMGGGGVDGAIHRAGGRAILEECKRIRASVYPDGLPTGEAVITTGGALRARHVIHTVGPIWRGGNRNEAALLARAYRASLEAAAERKIRAIAFPSISTGAYGYPVENAARIALTSVIATIRDRPDAFDEVRFVLFSQRDWTVYDEALGRILEGEPDDSGAAAEG